MAITGTAFWEEALGILEGGNRTSSVDYYLPNSGVGGTFAQKGEWANVIEKIFERTAAGSAERSRLVDLLQEAGFWAPTDDLSFWKNQEINSADVQDLANAAEMRMPEMFDAGGQSTNIGMTQPVGAKTGAVPGVMQGGTLTQITRGPNEEALWAMTYVVGGIEHVYTFASQKDMQATLGQDAVTSGRYGYKSMTWDQVNDGDTWILGDAATFAGQSGTYQTYFDNIMREAALEAGVRNPGLLGEYLSDPEVQRVLAMASAGDWSDDRQKAELRNTAYYQNVLYPGISAIMATGTSNPEAEYMQYMSSVSSSLRALGYQPDDDGTFRTRVGDMLTRGIVADDFVEFAPTFVRAEQSQEFAGALSKWTERDLGKSISFDDWFSVLEGTSAPELDSVVERAQIQFQSDMAGIGAADSTIARLADLTDFSEQQIALNLNQAQKGLLALGDQGLARYGLTQQAIVNASFNVNDEGLGMSAESINRLVNKTATELGAQDDQKAQFYSTFDQRKRPVKEGLAAGAPEFG